jgi:hypothetical protein
MRSLTSRTLVLLAVLAAMAVIGGSVAPAADVDTGQLKVYPHPSVEAIRGKVVMVSLIANGAVVWQKETTLGNYPSEGNAEGVYNGFVPVGQYDVRVEGEGLQTLVKRGVSLTKGGEAQLLMDMRPGQGVHIVEYATGGLSREEMAARLMAAEKAIADLTKLVAALQAKVDALKP